MTSALTFLLVLVVAWLATGNRIGDLPAYFRYSTAIASGYSSATGVEVSRNEWGAVLVLLFVAFLALLQSSVSRQARTGRNRTVLAWFAWLVLKEGFVRNDPFHNQIFFGLILVTLVIFDLSLPSSRLPPSGECGLRHRSDVDGRRRGSRKSVCPGVRHPWLW